MDTGLLITAEGGPNNLADLTAFLREMLGRQPTEDEHQEFYRRYLTVGGVSPVPKTGMELAAALQQELSDGDEITPVRAGMLYGSPSMTAAIGSLLDAGVTAVTVLDLSPWSATSGEVPAIAAGILQDAGIDSSALPTIYDSRLYVEAMGVLSKEAVFQLEQGDRPAFVLTFEEPPGADDAIVAKMTGLARQVAEHAMLGEEGSDPSWLPGIEGPGSGGAQPWILARPGSGGNSSLPPLYAVIEAVAASPMDSIVFCPLGRFFEDITTIYDIDVLASERALDCGLDFARAPMPTAMPAVNADLAAYVRELL